MKKKVLMLTSLVLALLMLVSCGSAGTAQKETTAETTAAAETKESTEAIQPTEPAGDTDSTGRTDFIFGLTSEPAQLTPYKTDEFTAYTINYQIFNRLIELNASGELVPSLAETWELNEDGTELTLHLRKGVLFHDGNEMIAEDVAYTYNQAIATPSTSGVTSIMKEMKVVDDYTVTLVLNEAFGPIESCLCSAYLGIVEKSADEADPDGYGRAPIGTGPYKFSTWNIGDSIILAANDDYFEGAPTIKDVTFKICLDTNAALVALENGEIDLCDTIPVSQKSTVEGSDTVAYASCGSSATYFLQMETNKAPFDDVRVRQAFSCAMNRDDVVLGACDGNGQAVQTMMLSDVTGYPEGFESAYGYDPERAKSLLEEAGYNSSNPLKLEFTCMDDSRMLPIAEVVQEQLRQVGVELTIEKYERATWLQKVRTDHDYLLALMNTSAVYNDADYLFGLYHSQYVGGRNWGDVNDPELDKLLEQGRSCTDPDERNTIYQKVVERMDEMQYVPAILRMDQPYFYNPDLKGFVANPNRRCFIYDYSW